MSAGHRSIEAQIAELDRMQKEDGATPPPADIRPAHYGGADNPFECIKVIDAWDLNFNLGNVLKYVSRAGKKPGVDALDDLKKARQYIDFEIARRSR